jgi:alkanesulfonate monooxygenase SsuD/methylene tetrahydromethanopterin reductase-like flavin-dependent oxidoreductase (luciferase family)
MAREEVGSLTTQHTPGRETADHGDCSSAARTCGAQYRYSTVFISRTITGLLRHGAVDFVGEWYTAPECEVRLRGPRPGGPPVLIGSFAQGPRMLRLVAEYADYWNAGLAFGRSHPDQIPPLREAVDAACLAQGRDPAPLARTVAIRAALRGRAVSIQTPGEEPLQGTPDEIATALQAFSSAGIDEVQVWLSPNTSAEIAAFAPVLEPLDRD